MNRWQEKGKNLLEREEKVSIDGNVGDKDSFFVLFFLLFFPPPAPRNSSCHGPVKIQTHYFKADVEWCSCQEDLMLMQSLRAATYLLRISPYWNFSQRVFGRKKKENIKKKKNMQNRTRSDGHMVCFTVGGGSDV